ncbi:hypothetical protein [Planococcus sp. YIM B11945]|uniref:hypothetical protein n=1 Tax=Planococcus sp. YIM B11945 TaxID=3435410 RepID=UPI003D7ED2A8
MKLMNAIVAFLLVVAAGGYALYFGSNLVVDSAVEQATAKLENNGQLENMQSYIEGDPELAGFMEEAKAAKESDLPFASKGDAAKVLVRKVGISELQQIQSGVESGSLSLSDAIGKLDTHLSDNELLALKVVAYKELYAEQ